MVVACDVAPCSLVETIRRFKSAYCLIHVAYNSETSVNFYDITRRSIPDNSRLHIGRHENLKSHKILYV
jgi:hypothetical protein